MPRLFDRPLVELHRPDGPSASVVRRPGNEDSARKDRCISTDRRQLCREVGRQTLSLQSYGLVSGPWSGRPIANIALSTKIKRERPVRTAPFFCASIKRLLDLAIARDLGRGGDGRSYLDLGALHLRKPAGSFARRNPVILHFLEILANVSIVKASGL